MKSQILIIFFCSIFIMSGDQIIARNISLQIYET